MLVTVSELEAIIAQTSPGEQVQYEAKPIGSVDHVSRKLTELKLSLIILSLSGLTDPENAFWRPSQRSVTRWNFVRGMRSSSIVLLRGYSQLARRRDKPDLDLFIARRLYALQCHNKLHATRWDSSPAAASFPHSSHSSLKRNVCKDSDLSLWACRCQVRAAPPP